MVKMVTLMYILPQFLETQNKAGLQHRRVNTEVLPKGLVLLVAPDDLIPLEGDTGNFPTLLNPAFSFSDFHPGSPIPAQPPFPQVSGKFTPIL